MKKKMKSEISKKTNIKSFSYELGTWISILEQSYSSISIDCIYRLISYIFMTLNSFVLYKLNIKMSLI